MIRGRGQGVEINFDKDEIIDSITDLYTGDKKYAVWAVSGVLAVTLIALIIVCVSPKKPKLPINIEGAFAADDELLIPDGPQSEVLSVTSREAKSEWGEEEAKQFLTVPATEELDDLSNANDFIIKDIMGSAP